ncbi:MFS transporter [Polaromonas sp. SM01]|uniref:MFS transporter n=1 Tax=Polaromonas sp. SM01 TaxID=3085630 RepID=UPI00298246E9|nr:MFS transporter [Polaromonas sp. SM01]MDW5444393.1 MFS transporter [Polaromonas sp. SM01]
MPVIPLEAPRPFFGAWVVRAAFVMAVFGWGVGFYGPPIFLHAVMQRTGWQLFLVSSAVTVHFLFGAMVVANLPRLYRRFGLPTVTTAGAVATALGVMAWAFAVEPWQLFLAALFSGGGWVMMGAAAINAIVAPWYVHARPMALAKAYNGASIGGVIFSPLWVFLIAKAGFQTASLLVGGVMVVTVALLARWAFARTPALLGQAPDGDLPGVPSRTVTSPHARPLPGKKLWTDRRFLTLAAGMAAGLFAQIGLLAHMFSLLVPALGAQYAGLTMGLATACAIAGRSVVAWAMPVTADRRLVVCAGYAVQLLGSLLLLVANESQTGLILLGVVLFGAGIGNATSLPPLIAQVEFVKEDVSRVVALIVAMGQATYAFAPMVFGILLAVSGGQDLHLGQNTMLFFMGAALVQLIAIALFLLGRRTSS